MAAEIEEKKEDVKKYMKAAVALVKKYVPPSPAKIQAVKDAGKMSVQPTEPGKRARLTFNDYLKSGDAFSLDMDLVNNRPLSAAVQSYLSSAEDRVTLTVTFGTLSDGSTYPETTVLDAPRENIKVTIQDSGYRKVSQ